MRRLMEASLFSLIAFALSSIPARAQVEKGPDQARPTESAVGKPGEDDPERIWRAASISVTNKMKILRGYVGAVGAPGPIITSRGGLGGIVPGGYDGSGGQKLIGLLRASEPLQDELRMSAKQKRSLKQLSEGYQKQIEAMLARDEFKEMAKKSPEIRRDLTARKMDESRVIRLANNSAILELLTSKQVERIDQVALQIRGPLAVAEPEIAVLIGLEADQVAEIKTIIEAMDVGQREVVKNAFGSSDPKEGTFTRRLPIEQLAPKALLKDDKSKDQAPDAADAKKPAPPMSRRLEDATRLDWSATRLEAIRNEAIVEVGKRLSRLQKIGFNQLLGRRIEDLSILVPDEYMKPRPPTPSPAVRD